MLMRVRVIGWKRFFDMILMPFLATHDGVRKECVIDSLLALIMEDV